jgi:hypothetical protein
MLRRLAGFLFLSAALAHAANQERALPVGSGSGVVFEF